MNTVDALFKGTVCVAALSAAGSLGWNLHHYKERPLPASVKSFDRVDEKLKTGDGKLDRSEFLDIVASLVDVNHDGKIDDDELNTHGKKVIEEFRSARGRSNLNYAGYLESTLRELKNLPYVLADWQSAVNKAKLEKD